MGASTFSLGPEITIIPPGTALRGSNLPGPAVGPRWSSPLRDDAWPANVVGQPPLTIDVHPGFEEIRARRERRAAVRPRRGGRATIAVSALVLATLGVAMGLSMLAGPGVPPAIDAMTTAAIVAPQAVSPPIAEPAAVRTVGGDAGGWSATRVVAPRTVLEGAPPAIIRASPPAALAAPLPAATGIVLAPPDPLPAAISNPAIPVFGPDGAAVGEESGPADPSDGVTRSFGNRLLTIGSP